MKKKIVTVQNAKEHSSLFLLKVSFLLGLMGSFYFGLDRYSNQLMELYTPESRLNGAGYIDVAARCNLIGWVGCIVLIIITIFTFRKDIKCLYTKIKK